jgi:dCTP deaminase
MILNDREIRSLAIDAGMIKPFEDGKKEVGRISHGLSSFGYDVRLGGKIKIQNLDNGATEIDPLRPSEKDWMTVEAEVFSIPPKRFILAHTMETFNMPRDITGFVQDKSTYARCGITVQNTVIEAGWKGVLTLEIYNQLERPVLLYAGHGIAQVMFVQGHACSKSYADGSAKYQNQKGVTIGRIA